MLNHCLELKIKCRSKQQETTAVCRAKEKNKNNPVLFVVKINKNIKLKIGNFFQIQDSEEYTPRYGNISISDP